MFIPNFRYFTLHYNLVTFCVFFLVLYVFIGITQWEAVVGRLVTITRNIIQTFLTDLFVDLFIIINILFGDLFMSQTIRYMQRQKINK